MSGVHCSARLAILVGYDHVDSVCQRVHTATPEPETGSHVNGVRQAQESKPRLGFIRAREIAD